MQDIGSILYFGAFYLLLMVLIPAKLLKLPLKRGQIADSAVKALLVSYTVCISLVYALGLLHIYNRYTLIAGLVITVIVYGIVTKFNYGQAFMKIFNVLALLGGGQYRIEIFFKDWRRKVFVESKNKVKSFFKNLTVGKVIYFLIGLAAFLILMQRRLTPFLGSYAYMTSDMYVHNEWINYMEAGDIFYDGIYPFGMHNILSALHLLSGLHLNLIFRYYGAMNCIMTVAAAVYFLRRISCTKAAVLVYLLLYGVTDFAGNAYAYRMAFTLSQECAMPFLLICLLFLGRFLEDKKKEDGIYFAFAASLILSMHFFTAIFAIALCGGLGLTYLHKIWKEKLMLPLCRVLLLMLCISLLPFLAGKLEGKYWQGSMAWALSVMKPGDAKDEEEKEKETGQEENADGNEAALVESEDQTAETGIEEKKNAAYLFLHMMVEKMYAFWGYVFWAGMIYAALYFMIGKKKWKDWRNKQFFAVWLTLLFCVILMGYWIIGLPQLMKEERVRMFIGYFGPVLFAIPLESLVVTLKKTGKSVAEVLGLVSALLCFYVTYGLGNIPFQTYFYLETSTAAEACVKIAKEYEKNTWTVVSPVEELSFIRGQGYHYELWEFIENMEKYEAGRYLEIPTKNVFFVLEKKPIPYNVTRVIGQNYEDMPIDLKDAEQVTTREMLGISKNGSMKFYNIYENRRALEAKLAAWIEVYSEMFPGQMTVYMDSEDCIIYRLEQNEYAWNNLAVDYGYNVISDEDYDRMLAARQKELAQQANKEQ